MKDMILSMTKPKRKREEVRTNYRLAPDVKNAVESTAEIASRSENLHAEYLLKLGLIVLAGVNPTRMTHQQVSDQFNELYGNKDVESA